MNPMDVPVEEFIEKNDRLVHSVCRRYVPMLDSILHTTGADYDDLHQIGRMGLLKARERFKPEYGLQLSTYAYPMIDGEILRFLRDSGMVKTPRWIKENRNKFSRLKMEGEDIEVIAAALDLSVEKAKIVVEYKSSHRSLSETVYREGDSNQPVTLEDTLYIGSFEDEVVNESVLQDFLKTLSERERIIWFSYHHDGLRQSKVAAKFGMTQVHISRILSTIEAKAVRYGQVKGLAKN